VTIVQRVHSQRSFRQEIMILNRSFLSRNGDKYSPIKYVKSRFEVQLAAPTVSVLD
jgi:hypothetical protein